MNSKYNLKNTQFPFKIWRLLFKIWRLNVNENAKAIQYDLHKYWVHMECNHLHYLDYKYFQGSNDDKFNKTMKSK